MRRVLSYLSRYPDLIVELLFVALTLIYLLSLHLFNEGLVAQFGSFDRSLEQSFAILATGNNAGYFHVFSSIALSVVLFFWSIYFACKVWKRIPKSDKKPLVNLFISIVINAFLIGFLLEQGCLFVIPAFLITVFASYLTANSD